MKYEIGELVRFRFTFNKSILGIVIKYIDEYYVIEPIKEEDKKHKEAWYAEYELFKV